MSSHTRSVPEEAPLDNPLATVGRQGLERTHLEFIRQHYGLTREAVAAAGLFSVGRHEVADLVGFDPGSAGVGIPFPGCDGFLRIRLLEPWRDRQGGEHRYLSAKGSCNRLYLPPLLDEGVWTSDGLLLITEGEFKALRAAQEGIPCIGLVGVWGWKRKASHPYAMPWPRRDELLPDFDRLSLRRPVVLVLDSDQPEGSAGYEAFERLAACLYRRGATDIRILVVPEVSNA